MSFSAQKAKNVTRRRREPMSAFDAQMLGFMIGFGGIGLMAVFSLVLLVVCWINPSFAVFLQHFLSTPVGKP